MPDTRPNSDDGRGRAAPGLDHPFTGSVGKPTIQRPWHLVPAGGFHGDRSGA